MSASQWYPNNYFLNNNKEDIVVFLSENVLNIYNFFQFTQRLFPENKSQVYFKPENLLGI